MRSGVFIGVFLVCLAGLASAADRPTILLISVDTLRADHVGAYGYAKETTPFLDARAREGLVFEKVIVPIPATTPSHASLLTGLHPFAHGATSNFTVLRRFDTVAAALKRRGYATIGSVAAFHLSRSYGFASGFDAFADPERPVARMVPHNRDVGYSAEQINAALLRLVDRVRSADPRKPLFLFAHYFDLHTPYGWWKSTPYPIEADSQQARIERYDEGVHHVDTAIARLYASLRARGLTNLVVIVTADHGEQIGERGLAAGHGDIYRETTDVPLIVWGPGISSARVPTAISSMEIAAGVVSLGGATLRNKVAATNTVTRELGRGPIGRAFAAFAPAASAPPEPVLVTGYPTYTRSIQLVKGDYRYIRNLEQVYRDVVATPIESSPDGRLLKPSRVALDAAQFLVTPSAYAPHVITFDHYPASPDCKSTLSVTLSGEASLLGPDAITAEGPVRIEFNAARFDQVIVWVSPARCAGRALVRVQRKTSSEPPPGAKQTHLFEHLFAVRKAHTSDELYDTSSDPLMERNLIDDPAHREAATVMERELRIVYSLTAQNRAASLQEKKYTAEEIAKLRALGYIR